MTWVRTDDRAPHHPKLVRAGAEACWLWQAGLCYSNAHLLDGRLPKDCLTALYAPLASKAKALAMRLVEVELWHDRGDHYEIHDYDAYQEGSDKESVEAQRAYERERKREQRAAKRPGLSHGLSPGQSGTTDGTESGTVPGTTDGTVPRASLARTRERERPPAPAPAGALPSHPIPSHSLTTFESSSGVHARAEEPPIGSDEQPELEPGEPFTPPDEREALAVYAQRGFSVRFVKRMSYPPSWSNTNKQHIRTFATWLEGHQGVDPRTQRDACDRALDGFFADPWVQEAKYPLADLANRPHKYLDGSAGGLEAMQERARTLLATGKMDEFKALQAEIQALQGRRRAG